MAALQSWALLYDLKLPLLGQAQLVHLTELPFLFRLGTSKLIRLLDVSCSGPVLVRLQALSDRGRFHDLPFPMAHTMKAIHDRVLDSELVPGSIARMMCILGRSGIVSSPFFLDQKGSPDFVFFHGHSCKVG